MQPTGGETMTVADLAIIAGLVFAWGTLSARLERFDMTAPIVFTVAGVLAGARLGRPAVLFIGWFGPRGLASVVFGVLALEDLAEAAARPAVTVIAFTVLLSVLAHGLSAGPLASRYGPGSPRHQAPPSRPGSPRSRTTPDPPLPGRRPAGEEGNR